MSVERIWLIDMGYGDQVWCDSPDPSDGIDPEDVTGPYVLGADERIAELEKEKERLKAEEEKTTMESAFQIAECKILRRKLSEAQVENKRLRELANYGGEVANKNTDTMLRQSETIEEQQAEIERLRAQIDEAIVRGQKQRAEIGRLKTENERRGG